MKMLYVAMHREMTVIVDIDGVLTDPHHRLHHIQQRPKDWDAFFNAMADDRPHPDMVQLVRVLRQHYNIALFTGRPASHRAVTEDWLARNAVPYDSLHMRRIGDHRPDHEVKPEFLPALALELVRVSHDLRYGQQVAFVIEDRPSMCRRWRALGFRVLQLEHEEF